MAEQGLSPSPRREWIEIPIVWEYDRKAGRLPPLGGRLRAGGYGFWYEELHIAASVQMPIGIHAQQKAHCI